MFAAALCEDITTQGYSFSAEAEGNRESRTETVRGRKKRRKRV